MRKFVHVAAGVGAVTGFMAWAPFAGAQPPPEGSGASNVVFVQTDQQTGNQIVSYDRAADGALTPAGTFATGGDGGRLNGSAVDFLASQGSLAYDAANGLLYAVNAGSDTVSVFSVNGDQLTLTQVIDSGGTFPVSVAVAQGLVYVLNAENGGSVSGFRVAGGKLHPIENSARSLGLTIPTGTTQFTSTPGQVAFSPDGSQLIVTTKGSGNSVDVFGVSADGRLSATPVVNSESGALPFAVSFDAAGHLLVAEAGADALATFDLNPNGTLTALDAVVTGQAATCWVAPAQGYFYTSNAGAPSVTGFAAAPNGHLTSLGNTATDPGTVDAAASADGKYLYVQTAGKGVVDEFSVQADGSLQPIGSVVVPDAAGGEGIVAF